MKVVPSEYSNVKSSVVSIVTACRTSLMMFCGSSLHCIYQIVYTCIIFIRTHRKTYCMCYWARKWHFTCLWYADENMCVNDDRYNETTYILSAGPKFCVCVHNNVQNKRRGVFHCGVLLYLGSVQMCLFGFCATALVYFSVKCYVCSVALYGAETVSYTHLNLN